MCSAGHRFEPPAPPLAPDRVTGLGVLMRLRRNAFSAFPARCFTAPTIKYRVGITDLILANTPDAMRHVLADQPDRFRRVQATRRVLGPILGRGLAAAEGEAWRRQRRTLAPAFTPRTLPVLSQHIAACAEATCAQIEASKDSPINLLSAMQDLSLAIAARSMFSLETVQFGPELRRLLAFYSATIGRPRASDFLLSSKLLTPTDVRRALFRRRWARLIASIIADRRSAASPDTPRDMFDMLADAYKDEDEGLLADEVSTMLFAGHETTGLTLFWACFLLANAPEWQVAVRDEARACDVSPSSAGEALARLPLTRAVIEETLRLYPPAYMSARTVMDSHDLCGLPVQGGNLVLLPFCMLHRNPAFWASPSRFDPSRFLGASRPDRFTFLPFGAGPRVCIGAQLAVAESMLVLARLLRDSAITVEDADPVQPVGSFSTRPSHLPVFKLRRYDHQAPASRSRAGNSAYQPSSTPSTAISRSLQ
ncbi:cytochrome P450 [Methylobacterium organophilum]|nr:cytochrome P450 [Methylobacterium organophilum]